MGSHGIPAGEFARKKRSACGFIKYLIARECIVAKHANAEDASE